MNSVILLGPQRFRASARAAVRALDVDGPIAVINAGWQEREPDDGELHEVLDRRSYNLGLYGRWQQLLDVDVDYAVAEAAHQELLEQQQALYALRLHHDVEAAYAVWRRPSPDILRDAAVEDAIASIRALDSWHAEVMGRLGQEFAQAEELMSRQSVQAHRAEIAAILESAGALVVTGGHVGVLLHCLRLFDVHLPEGTPVIAWSAGAMALSECVVLFNDEAARGYGHAEVYQGGLAWYRGIVPLPHARHRLRLDEPMRIAAFARRFSDKCCLVLDDGVRLPLPPDGGCPPGAPVLSRTGQISVAEVA